MIVFTTGTINETDAVSVGLVMVERLRDDLIAHAAWELVEEFTPSGGAVRWYVFKCLASASGLSADFFVVVGRTLSSGELRFGICESYDSTTHTMQYFASGEGFTAINYDVNGRNPATYVLSTVQLPAGTTTPRYHNWIPSGASSKWWLTVADDGFTVAFNGAAKAFIHLGVYAPLTPLPIALPLQIVGSDNTSGGITRNPAVASTSAYAYALIIQGGGSTPGSAGPILGFRGDLRTADKLQSNQVSVAEQGMTMIQFPADYLTVFGWALGKQNRMRIGGTVPTGFAFGDAYQIDGNLWVPYDPADSRMWDTGVAA